MRMIGWAALAAASVTGVAAQAQDDLAAFGFNMLDPARRERVFQTACATAGPAVRRALTA